MCKCVRVTNTALYTYCGIQQAITTSKYSYTITSKCRRGNQCNIMGYDVQFHFSGNVVVYDIFLKKPACHVIFSV